MKKIIFTILIGVVGFILGYNTFEYTNEFSTQDGKTVRYHAFILGDVEAFHVGKKTGHIKLFDYEEKLEK